MSDETSDPVAADVSQELEVMRAVARQASKLVMSIYHGGFEVELKGKNDPVTRADREANELITRALAKAFPSHGIMAEESAPTEAERAAIAKNPRIFFVDPVDGTREFADKNGEFCVMIGLAIHGRAVAGVVAVPVEERLYWGSSTTGTFVEPLEPSSAAEPERVSLAEPPHDLTAVISRSHPSPKTKLVLARMGVEKFFPCGSVGLKIVRVIDRKADLYVHPNRGAKLWDACAPEALVLGAGGVMTNMHGSPIDYRAPLGLEDGIVASRPEVLPRIIEAIAAVNRATSS